MSAAGVTCSRTIGHARNLCSTALAIAGFLAATAALFAFSLDPAEGSRLTLPVLWTGAVSPVLPLLCAVLAMDTWSEERRTGRIETLLSLPVRERELVFGKFLGVFFMVFFSVVISLVADLAVLLVFSSTALDGVNPVSFLPALAALSMQGALYVSVSVALSAFVTSAVAAVTLSLAVVWAFPRGVWHALVSWFPSGSEAFGEFPLDAHAVDIAGGVVSSSVIAGYVIFIVAALFVADKAVFALRFSGKRSAAGRASTFFTMLLSVAVAVAATVLSVRLDLVFDLPFGNGSVRFSQRTRGILAESRGDIYVTCFVPRADRRFRSVAHFLRSFSRESLALGGARMSVSYVDPRWDIGESTRLTRNGVTAPSIVFSNRRRRVSVPLADGWGERSCASALLRLSVPPSRNAVYWTVGHGESSFSDYGPVGMSDIARELSRDGYRNFTIDLTGESKIPADCALIAVAGAKTEFSRTETARLDSFLRQGGRLLLMADGPESALLSTLIPSWGAIAKEVTAKPQRTLTGTDSVISEFGTHAVSCPLKGSQVVLERPVVFAPSAAAGGTAGADSIEFSPLALIDAYAPAVMLERGSGAGSDTAIRPTRIAVIGDATFVRNSQLESRANANRDLFINCVSYLSGSQAITQGGTDGELFVTGLDRRARLRYMYITSGAIPLALMSVMLFVVWRRRRRR